MSKGISQKSVDKIIKSFSSKEEKIVIKCGTDEYVINVNPYISWSDWYKSIALIDTFLVRKIDGEDDSSVRYTFLSGISSVIYKCAVMYCFTDISKSLDTSKMLDLATLTDIPELIEEKIPDHIIADFKDDFYRSIDYMSNSIRVDDSVSECCEKFINIMSKLKEFADMAKEIPIDELLKIKDE